MDAGFLELSTEASTPAATVCATCSLHSAAKLDGASEVQANTEQAAKKATAVSAAKSITPNAASGKQMSAASEESVEQEEGTDVQPVANVDDAEEALRLATEMLDLREKYDEIRKKSPQENGCTEEQAYQWLKGEREAMISEGECENALYQLWMFDRVLAPYGEHNHSEKSDHCEVAKKLYILARNRDLDLLRGSASDACKGRLAKWKGMMTVIHDPPSFFSVTHIQQNSPYAHGIQHLDNFLEKQEELRTLLAGSFAAAIPVLDDSVDLSLRPIEFLFIPKKKLADLIKKLKVLAQPGSP
ncbi:unnamed protein product [Amoebophrya sp. A25]|nr:unnamed protein product [Amoebophrya sp. A25]|eukprot:GSA25T00027777001.1